jgi:hypothetical protein
MSPNRCPCEKFAPHKIGGTTWCTCGHQAAHHSSGSCAMPVVTAEVHPRPALAADFVDRMLTDIRTKVVDNRFEDDALTPDLMAKVLNELRAASQTTGEVGLWAADLLQALWHRAESGVPFGESLVVDWEPGEPRYMETLDEDERRDA